MKLLLFAILLNSVFAEKYMPDIPFVGKNKKGNPIVKEHGKCFKVIDGEYLVRVSCKTIVREK